MNVETYKKIYEKMLKKLSAAKLWIDNIEGSIITDIYSGVARVIEQLYIDVRTGFDMLMRTIPYSIFNFKKKKGTFATGHVIFFRETPLNKDSGIPIGTKVKYGEYTYITQEAGIILSGELESGGILVKAEKIGKEYNCENNRINEISSIVQQDIIGVRNDEYISGGNDNETDYDANNRFIDYLNSLQGTTKRSVVYQTQSIEGVSDCKIVEHFPPKDGYNFTIIVNNGSGTLPGDLKNEIIKKINDYKAPGVNYNVKSVSQHTLDVVYSYSTNDSVEGINDQIKDKINEYVSELLIGQPFIKSEIISRIQTIAGIKSVSILNPTKDVYEISDDEVIILSSISSNS